MHEMTANYHTHTVRCHHAIGTEREYIETAIARGLKILGFADHSPQLFPGDYYSNFRMYPEQAENYVSTLRRLRDEYKNDIDILIGFETEYYPEIFERLIEFLAPYDIDYMILGQHFIDNEYDTSIYSGFSTSDESRLERYTNAVLEGLSTGKFSYVAHPDLFNFDGDNAAYEKQARRLCEGARALDIPLEINFLGLATKRHYPSERFYKIAAEVGNSFIFGCDAHDPNDVLNPRAYEFAVDFVKRLGITPTERLKLKAIR